MNTPNHEIEHRSADGYLMLAIGIALPLLGFWLLIERAGPLTLLLLVAGVIACVLIFSGLYMLEPNQAAVLKLFGAYRGTDRSQGLRWANPFYSKSKLSLRTRNFVSETLKVNDHGGNPIEIAAAIVWRVEDTAQASFNVDNYELFVRVQSEAGIRHLASLYAYDNLDDSHPAEQLTLRGGSDIVAKGLKRELDQRLAQAGLAVDSATFTHLAYAPEIAGAMLRRQQAEAVLAARRKIVKGAVDMVEMALNGLSEKGLVELDDERRAAMVSNLLVVLVGEKDVAPVINSGSLYQ
ncbi:SPFH domain-containing protein [Chitinimonas sp.]|uniref:SPFH domain-containing protein n=1 Tax=Chitinimonas sp. TaxID=1934313 RepID=UPI0035ADC11F